MGFFESIGIGVVFGSIGGLIGVGLCRVTEAALGMPISSIFDRFSCCFKSSNLYNERNPEWIKKRDKKLEKSPCYRIHEE